MSRFCHWEDRTRLSGSRPTLARLSNNLRATLPWLSVSQPLTQAVTQSSALCYYMYLPSYNHNSSTVAAAQQYNQYWLGEASERWSTTALEILVEMRPNSFALDRIAFLAIQLLCPEAVSDLAAAAIYDNSEIDGLGEIKTQHSQPGSSSTTVTAVPLPTR